VSHESKEVRLNMLEALCIDKRLALAGLAVLAVLAFLAPETLGTYHDM
jgi:hypothetical protein